MTEREIFTSALEKQSAAERDAFLDGACANDSALREHIEGLLRERENLNSLLERPPVGIAVAPSPTVDRGQPEQPGTLIGPYKLLEQIGEGGMGLVYMAEQQRPMRRLVALKLIKPGMDSKQVIARFEAEKQALAMMDHEHIAKVFEAGTTDTGRFYFAMELVRGMPINEFCDQQRLSVRERLELFIQVCQAVQHAHQKGIIHRDLKPTNVLVTMNDIVAIPKVIDFGIAKALGQSLTDHTLHTGFAQLVGTPLYMSPEQAKMNQLGVDTRSDVYSLGVLLYELLTGTTPFDKETLSKAGLDEMRRMIREDEPPRPSARMSTLQAPALSTISQRRSTDPRRISTTLRGELDWIVMKALEKDRSRRYESASAFATDIQRYLSDEPVLACPPTTMYHFQKFARKHKPALATAAAIALCLILGTTVSAWQAARATQAEAEANANATQAQEKTQEATTQRDEARALAEKLQAALDQLRQTNYTAHMNLARHAWEGFATDQVKELLDQHHPKPGQTDLRGFEWYYLNRLCNAEPLLTLKGHARRVYSVAYSPDGKRLASGSGNWDGAKKDFVAGEVKVWDAQTGQELLSLKGLNGGVMSVRFSPDGKRLASGSGNWDDTKKVYVDSEVKVWNAQTGQEILSISGHSSIVNGVAFSPDGKRLASCSGDWAAPELGGLKVWDAETGQELLSLKGHTAIVTNVAFSPDGTRLASTSGDYKTKIWDAQSGQELLSVPGAWGGSIAFSPDGKRLASGRSVWDTQTGKELLSFDIFNADGLIYSPDGKRLASTAADQPVRIYDAQTGKELFSFKAQTGRVSEVAFSPDGKRLAFPSADGTIKVRDATASQEARTFRGLSGKVTSVAFAPDGKRVAVGGQLGEVKVWDMQTGQELLALKGHQRGGVGVGVAYSPDGKRLASAATGSDSPGAGGVVKVWDAQTGRELLSLEGGSNMVSFIANGKRLASGGKVWDAQSGEELLTLPGGRGSVFSPDGKRLANGGKVWDAQTGQELLSLKANTGRGPVRVAFSPDGKRLVTGAFEGTVNVWDALTGDELLSLKGNTGGVNSVAFSPDGKRVASHTQHGAVKVWDAQTGQETLSLRGGHGIGLAFSQDGHYLATAGDGGPIIWDATPLPEKP